MKLDIYQIERQEEPIETTFVDGSVQAGFPSPAQDYVNLSIDLNKELISHRATTFYTRVSGDSMIEANVHDGDLLIVDRGLEPRNNDMAVCFVDGEFTLKYIEVHEDGIWLRPANTDYPMMKIDPESNFTIWGVVTYSIHKQR